MPDATSKRPREAEEEASSDGTKLSKRARKSLQKRGGDASHIVTKAERAAALKTEDMTKTRASGAREARAAKAAKEKNSTLPGGEVGPVMKKKVRRGKGGGTAKAIHSALDPQTGARVVHDGGNAVSKDKAGKDKAWTFKDRGNLNTAPRDDREPSLQLASGKPEITGPVLDPATGITTLPGNLQYMDVKVVSSTEKKTPKDGKPVTIKYRGIVQPPPDTKLMPVPFAKGMLTWWLGSGDVIPGLDHGIRGMRAGGQRKVIIPPNMAYGEAGDGTDGKIPPYATLLFDVQLIRVGTKAEELQQEEKALERMNKENAHHMVRKPSGRGMMAEMGQPSKDKGVIAMPLPSELCKKGRNRSGVPKQVSAWKEKRRRKTGKAASEEKNKRGSGGDFEKGYTRRGGGK